MDTTLREHLFQQAKQWVLEAGKTIREKIHDPLTVDTKSNANDLVTEMDKDTEAFFVRKIRSTYSDHRIFSEEGYGDRIESMDGTIWIIDPIDGTMNFVHLKRNFAISVGIFHNGIGEIAFIYDVMSDILYHAKKGDGAFKGNEKLEPLSDHVKLEEAVISFNHLWLCENRVMDEKIMQNLTKTVRGTRSLGSAALDFALVAEGKIDCYLAMSLSPWDFAAGLILVYETGGITTDLDGKPVNMLRKNPIVTGNANVQQTIITDYTQKGKK